MHLHEGLHRRCVDCPATAPSCNCGVGLQCVITSRSCDACPTASCVEGADGSTTKTSNSGVSGGAIAGAVIGVLILLGASIALLIWYRRRQRRAQPCEQPQHDVKPDVPARAEAVLSRPDPVEKPRSPSPQQPDSVRMYSVMSDSTINLDPHAKNSGPSSQQTGLSRRPSAQSNPFTDTHSIQTASASTQSTNVIPIALVPHGSVSSAQHSPVSDNQSGTSSTRSSVPTRPAHSPDLGLRFDPLSSGLNLEHVNVSKDSFRPPHAPYAQSQASGFSGFSSRDSVMTSGSFASDVLYEAPQIVTNAGRVNLSKAEVVSVQGTTPNTPMSSNSGASNQGLKPSMAARASKAMARSPLAQTSFGPADAMSVSETDAEGQEIEYHLHRTDPFGDEHTPRTGNSTTTFGGHTPIPIPSTASPGGQYQASSTDDRETVDSPATGRPISTLTQATSIIGAEIGGATVVRLNSTGSTADRRLTSAKLVTPTSGPLNPQDDRVLQQQQAQALAAARARAAASGLPMPGVSSSASSTASGNGMNLSLHSRRVSEASVMSAGADSLLESFTFVPPSPISSRPPRSPLAQQAHTIPPVPPLPKQVQQEKEDNAGHQPSARQVQGMSSASTGIEGYDFRIDEGQTQASAPSDVIANGRANGGRSGGVSKPPPSAASNNLNGNGTLKGRQRASLDTLALTADLSAFPLNFDETRGSFGVSK